MQRLVLSLFISLSVGAAHAQWGDSDYNKYTYKTFAKSKVGNQRINFKQIDYGLLHAAIFYETNRARVKNGRKVFKHSPALEKAALGHSQEMVKRNFFSHTSPKSGHRQMGQRLALVGIKNAYSAENIANSFGLEYKAGTPVSPPRFAGDSFKYSGKAILAHTYVGFGAAIVDQWMNSPGHRANILNRRYTFLGNGAAHYQKKSFYNMDYFKATQNFSSIKGP